MSECQGYAFIGRIPDKKPFVEAASTFDDKAIALQAERIVEWIFHANNVPSLLFFKPCV